MTSWQVAGYIFALTAYAVAGLRGGRPERFGAGALLIDFLISSLTYDWQVGGFFLAGLIENWVLLLVFGWLCFRSDRWWLLVVTAAMALEVLTHAIRLLDPAFSQDAAASARIGLQYLIDLTILLGVCERWLRGSRRRVRPRGRRRRGPRPPGAPGGTGACRRTPNGACAAGVALDQGQQKGPPPRERPFHCQPANGLVFRRQPPPGGRPGSSDGPRAA